MRRLFLLTVLALPAQSDSRWFDRHAEGWFWYEAIPETSKPDQKPPSADNIKPSALTTAWLRENMGHYLDQAIDRPSQENVRDYLYLERLVKERAERFAQVGRQVIESDPLLDENVRRPIAPAAARVSDDSALQARENVLHQLAKKTGLLFYYQGECRLCQMQAQTLRLMQENYGFELMPFSVDGVFLSELPNSRINKKPPTSLNIQTYPALFLMRPPKQIVALRQGALSLMQLQDKLVEVAFEQGWIDQKTYRSTRITRDIRLGDISGKLYLKNDKHLSTRNKSEW